MLAFLISVVVAIVVTVLAARWRVGRRPGAAFASHVMVAAAAFPALCVVLFAVITAYTLMRSDMNAPGASANVGMPIFALFFFLIYGIVIGVVVGVPTAIVAVRAFLKA